MVAASDEIKASGQTGRPFRCDCPEEALVTGTLTMKPGVERPGMRLIVKVETVKPADGKEK
jgi:hypothetical protein